jgi:hypothetical protein
MHLRMNGPKKLMNEIKAQEGSLIQIVGIMKKGQYGPEGVGIGGGVRVSPGAPQAAGGMAPYALPRQTFIDVEGWRPANGFCPRR